MREAICSAPSDQSVAAVRSISRRRFCSAMTSFMYRSCSGSSSSSLYFSSASSSSSSSSSPSASAAAAHAPSRPSSDASTRVWAEGRVAFTVASSSPLSLSVFSWSCPWSSAVQARSIFSALLSRPSSVRMASTRNWASALPVRSSTGVRYCNVASASGKPSVWYPVLVSISIFLSCKGSAGCTVSGTFVSQHEESFSST
mmetsp:Transcript_19681/g.31767  ORF Transcript_19681/g.31767 Transcript_19681/m.31767 type:complete len:200 (-) Transcript_19681:123-722(-)